MTFLTEILHPNEFFQKNTYFGVYINLVEIVFYFNR